jgi:probable F420-dependent oxidoreductase
MKFSIALPIEQLSHAREFMSQEAVAEMSRTAEEAGFDACNITDHPVPTARWLAHGGHHAQDPFVLMALIAAATKRIKVHTNILVLPYRHPFILARAISTLDYFSHGRVIIGAAAGYLKGEYKALGVDFEARNELSDDAIRAMKAAWSGNEFTFEGKGYHAQGNSILPLPAQKPGPPIWVGGNSMAAIRRAVDLADGWCPFAAQEVLAKTARTAVIANFDDLAARIGKMREYAKQVGRSAPLTLATSPFGREYLSEPKRLLELVPRYRALGVEWLIMDAAGDTLKDWCASAQRFAREVMEPLRAA